MSSTSTSWCFLDSGEGAGSLNMALDELLARRLLEEGGMPLLRLFRWKPWAVSLGYNQSVADLDVEACHRDGIDVVRRPTGGRAILHAEELTYSVVMQAGRRSILQVYNEVSAALVRGIGLYGVEVSLQKSQPNFQEAYRHPSSVPCFTSSARYEIEWNGRKLIGSAQRRFGEGENDVVLQHGSILCGPAHRRLGDYLAVRDPAVRKRVRREMEEKTVDLAAITGRTVDVGQLGECIRRGFALEWGVEFRKIDISSVQEVVHEALQ
jgi:lipoate-protein ligase A